MGLDFVGFDPKGLKAGSNGLQEKWNNLAVLSLPLRKKGSG